MSVSNFNTCPPEIQDRDPLLTYIAGSTRISLYFMRKNNSNNLKGRISGDALVMGAESCSSILTPVILCLAASLPAMTPDTQMIHPAAQQDLRINWT